MEESKRRFQKGQKVLVVGGSEEERKRAITDLQADGVEVVSKEEAIKIISTSLDIDTSNLAHALIVRAVEPPPDITLSIKEKPKKTKGSKSKFSRQPWQ